MSTLFCSHSNKNLREIPGKAVSAGDELEVQLAPLGDWRQTVENGRES